MSSPSNRAANEARADEQQRTQAVQRTQGAVNQAYNSPQRAADIAMAVGAKRDFLTRDLNEQKATNDRKLKFSLARGGMTGGSLQVDKQALAGREYGKGVLQVDGQARAFGSELEAGDQEARARLIQLATSGLDATTGAAQAAAAMRTSLEAGKANMRAQGVGDVFSQFSKYYQDSKDSAVRRRADKQAYGLYGGAPGFGYGQ